MVPPRWKPHRGGMHHRMPPRWCSLALITMCHLPTLCSTSGAPVPNNSDSDSPTFDGDLWKSHGICGDEPALSNAQVTRLLNEEPIDTAYDTLSLGGGSVDSANAQPVYLKVFINSVGRIEQKGQVYRMKGFLLTTHVDCRLTHNSVFPYIDLRRANQLQNIFVPTVTITNQQTYEERLDQPSPKICAIARDGLVMCTTYFLGTFSASFNFDMIPFDTQYLPITVQSFHSEYVVQLHWYDVDKPISLLNMKKIAIPGWDADWNYERTEATGELAEVLEQRLSTLQTNIKLHRRSYDYEMGAVMPAVMYWFLSYLGFWLPTEAVPARAATGVIPVLMLLNLHTRLQSELPPSVERLPWIVEFVLVTTVLCVINFAAYTIGMWASKYKQRMEARYTGVSDGEHVGEVSLTPPEVTSRLEGWTEAGSDPAKKQTPTASVRVRSVLAALEHTDTLLSIGSLVVYSFYIAISYGRAK